MSTYRHFILGGTIKAATSSLFSSLSLHPEICGSRIKETWFFSIHYSGDAERDRRKYQSFFSPGEDHRVLFEASPDYLGFKHNVAPRIRQLLPDAKLLFVLRNPVDRLYSSFNFARSKLELPHDMSFETYVDICQRYERGEITQQQAGLPEKHLRALQIGNYADGLENFFREFPASQVKVMFYDEIQADPVRKLAEIAEYIGVDPAFFEGFAMKRSNVTFSARYHRLHSRVLAMNRLFEPMLRKMPSLKQRLVSLYKLFNQAQQGYEPMAPATRQRLIEYYAPGNLEVKRLLSTQVLPGWIEEAIEECPAIIAGKQEEGPQQ